MSDTPIPEPELPPSLRLLKTLVTVLTVTMIGGVITVVGLLVTRMPDFSAAPVVPERLALPAGAEPVAVTTGRGWFAVVTSDDRILFYDAAGVLFDTVQVTLP